jgi:hypothetical protein
MASDTLFQPTDANPFDDLPQYRHEVWKSYRLLGLAEDGYPLAKAPLNHNKTIAHPIHGAYLIIQHVKNYQASGRRESGSLLKALTLTRSSVARMAAEDNSFKFYYQPTDAITPYHHVFYSGLTQAKYLEALSLLYTESGDEWVRAAAEKIFNSFLVPIEDGGVLLRTEKGTFLEEYPTEVPTYVLNGWLTTINEIFSYAIICKNNKAIQLAKENAKTLVGVIHLYDLPEMFTTRYKLSGPVLSRLLFDDDSARINSVQIKTGGLQISKSVSDTRPYDTLHAVKLPGDGERSFVFRVVLSMIDYPDTPELQVKIESPIGQKVRWSIGIPGFDPRYTTQRAVGQRFMREFTLSPGRNTITLPVPWDAAIAWVGAPVPFSKKIGERFYNAYHFIHVKGLSQLHEFHRAGRLLYWRDRWLKYIDQWPSFAPYQIEGVCHAMNDIGRWPSQAAYLRAPKWYLVDGQLIATNSNDVSRPINVERQKKNLG